MKIILYKLIILFLLGLTGNGVCAQTISGPTEFCPSTNSIITGYQLADNSCGSISGVTWSFNYLGGVTIQGSNSMNMIWTPNSGDSEGTLSATYNCTNGEVTTSETATLDISVLNINEPIITSPSTIELTCNETTFTVDISTQPGSSANIEVTHPECFGYTYNPSNSQFNFTTDNSASGEICITIEQPNCGTSKKECITVKRECEDNLAFSSTSSIDNEYNSVDRYITASDASTASFSSLEFKAGKAILLQPGFCSNQSFLAHIGPCSCAPVSGNGCFYQKSLQSVSIVNAQNSKDNMAQETNLLSTEDVVNNTFIIYPNPSQGMFTIHFEEESSNTNIQIFDVMGKLRKSISTNSPIQTIDASELENGVYIVVLSDKERLFKEKIIISKAQ
jgi:hypothetical protein